jgi:hypothetical protein
MDLWATLGSTHFYYRYRFALCKTALWDEHVKLTEDAGVGCLTCAYAMQARLAEAVAFEEEAQSCKPRVLGMFGGTGAVSLSMESATSGMKTTHAIKLAPSATRTLRCPPLLCVSRLAIVWERHLPSFFVSLEVSS